MKSGLQEMLHCLNATSEMSVLERQCSRLKWQQDQSMGHQPVIYFDENDGSFLGFNGDQGLCELVVNGAMKPDPGLENGFSDGFRSFLSGSDFQMSCALPRTASCPPNVAPEEPAGKESSKKRKADKTQIPKAVEEKKMKGHTDEGSKITEQNSTTTASTAANNKNTKTKASEAPKTDYIHVRARRGQATDSHSLAERVRREKISERMKYLQDLVPGCNKITGKAGMLDEIINYVQSLQRQVEFLSMKLAAINPRLDFNVEDYLVKEMFPATMGPELVNQANLQFDLLGQGVVNTSLEMVANPMDIALRRTISAPVTIPQTIFDSNIQNITWDDELQNLYSMEYQQGRASTSFFPQPYTGFQESGHVKLEM